MVYDTYQWENDGFLQETGEPWKILYMKDGVEWDFELVPRELQFFYGLWMFMIIYDYG
jgi:hypothetical protein